MKQTLAEWDAVFPPGSLKMSFFGYMDVLKGGLLRSFDKLPEQIPR
jgi:hypothetical protein